MHGFILYSSQSSQTILIPLQAFKNEYALRGLSVSAMLLVPFIPPPSMVPSLTVQQIAIIAVLVSVVVALIAVAIVIVAVWR